MANFLLKRTKKERLIVEASRTGFRVIRPVFVEDKLEVQKFFFVSWPYLLYATESDFRAGLDKLVKNLIVQFPPKTSSVVFCASDPTNTVKWVQTPVIAEEDELEEYLRSKKIMPDVNQYLADFSALGPSISELKKSQDVLVRGVDKGLAQEVMDVLEEKGYELEALEFPVNALDAYYQNWFFETKQEEDIMLHLGWETSSLSIFHHGELRFSVHLGFRLLDYVDILHTRCNVEPIEATRMARNSLLPKALGRKVDLAIVPNEIILEVTQECDHLLDEIQIALAYYTSRVMEWKVEHFSRIIISGLELWLPEFGEKLKARFNLPVERFSILEKVKFAPEVVTRVKADGAESYMLTSLGLALRHLEE